MVDAGQIGCSMVGVGTVEQDSQGSDSAAEQHCSVERQGQASLHRLLAYAGLELDFVVSALNWQAIPVNSGLHRLGLKDLVRHMRARVELDSSRLRAGVVAGTLVEKIVHRVGKVVEDTNMVVAEVVVNVHRTEQGLLRQIQAESSAPFAWLG